MSSPSFINFSKSGIKFIDGDRGVNYPNKSELKSDGHCVFLNTGNVKKTGFDFSQVEYIDEEKDSQLRKGKIEKGDIVLTTRGTVGNVAIVDDGTPYSNIRINSGMVIVRANPEEYDPYFILLFFRSALFEKQYLSHGSGSAQPQLPISALKNICFPDFDIEIQRAIVKAAICIDKKIELNNRINAELEAMAKTLYDYWFVQFDFPDANGKPYLTSGGKMVYSPTLKREIPEGWEDGTLEELGQIVGGSTPSTRNPENFTTEGTPWIAPNDLSNNQGNKFISRGGQDVSAEGIRNASLKKYPAGTVLLSSRAPIGYMAISRNEVTTNQGFKSFIPNKGYSTEFIYYTVKNSLKAITQYASGSTFKEVSGGTLKTVKVVLPSVAMSDAFTAKVKPIFNQQDFIERENAELVTLRDWLLPMLMNGQVTVGEAN
ncbi:restriction endonuclease subunit S [uncultured Alteromonas sp.]|uniref:restriction endonuclease subunit S n=1 Tax=uncultured Alteromonas sp. TaxID=179113 RepID=UPI0030EDE8CE|tara:strand:- start:4104 stop:5396 length:1293 start_codon:yes stop_codon:yes gene_type:complete